MSKLAEITAKFTEKTQCLFVPRRYKVLYGGRAAGRSWACARALLLLGIQRPGLRVLCAREYQNSINESVYRLLVDQISALGLGGFYEVQQSAILGRGAAEGTRFSFEGIKNNVLKIKSYEGADICWVEEANKVSKYSWNVLVPTIRKPQSEIWMTFNPELEEDYTYSHFVTNADPQRSFVVHMTWRDNPWVSQETLDEMRACVKEDPDGFINIWEGRCVQVLSGAIYANELRKMILDGRITQVPCDPATPVDTFWDIGRADATAIWFGQQVGMQWRVVDYYENSFVGDVSHYVNEIRSRDYVLGTTFLPHDAKAKRLGMRYSVEEQVRSAKLDVEIVDKVSIVDGINASRLLLRQCWIDERKCADGLKALRHYRYKVSSDGVVASIPDHNSKEAGWASHGADAFRYMAIVSGLARASLGHAARVLRNIRAGELELGLGDTPRDTRLDWLNG